MNVTNYKYSGFPVKFIIGELVAHAANIRRLLAVTTSASFIEEHYSEYFILTNSNYYYF